MLRFILLLVFIISGLGYGKELTLYAASNFSSVFDKIKVLYEKEYPEDKIKIIYGSSGKGYHQIIRGAPFDIFFSADMRYLDSLYKKGLTKSKPRVFLIGKIVLWTGKNSGIKLKGLKTVLDPDIERIALANPDLAPYGKAAVECLKKYGLYSKIKTKIVTGENISKTVQFVETGAADIGFIALSLAKSERLKRKGNYIIINTECHSPIKQGYIVLKDKNKAATKFLKFLKRKDIVKILVNSGYTLPGEDNE